MPKISLPLTDAEVKKARPAHKVRKLADGDGMYLEVHPSGNKVWRFRYRRPDGKEVLMTFGKYPLLGLAAARARRAEIRRMLHEGIDPILQREAQQQAELAAESTSFEHLAREWHGVKAHSWSDDYAHNVLHRLQLDIFPAVGRIGINAITHRQMIDVLRQIEARGAHEIAKRQRAVCGQIFSYAIQVGAATRNPIADMRDVLQRVTPTSFAAIDADQLPAFLKSLRSNQACMSLPTRVALQLMMLTFVRTSELIETPWREIEEGSSTWVIPWPRMKMGKRKLNPIKKDHIVPLSRQALALLDELRPLTGRGTFVFPNQRDHNRPMSNGAVLKALERMGYRNEMTGHGFRALAMSTIKERLGYRHEVIDRQLAHVRKDKVERAYDRAEFVEERRDMMQAWADYLNAVTPK